MRIPEEHQHSVVQELEEADRMHPDAAKRRTPRYRYIVREGLIIEVAELSARYIVRPRNLSKGGMSFLHGSFMHTGRACVIGLKTIDGERVLVAGQIVRCRCVRGRVHEVGMQFNDPIDVELFVDPRKPGAAAPCLRSPGVVTYDAQAVMQAIEELRSLAAASAPEIKLLEQLLRLAGLVRAGGEDGAASKK